MKIDVAAVRRCLKSFDFNTLFREHLGWDNHQAQLDVPVDGSTIRLTAVAQKRGFTAYVCGSIPDRPTRLKIDHQVTKTAREHFVIYADQGSGQQVWQWVRREPGKPLASRDHRFHVAGAGDALIQRLEHIAVTLDEEEGLTVVDVAGRARAAFDVDKVTKKFYERFKAEHAAFLKFIKGIKAEADLEWYTSLMLNRLMFVYFIQKKGFLDGDSDYLRNRMRQVRELKGKDKFQSFYRYFLVRLFHDGLGKHKDDRKLDRELEKLLGKVPYLNGGFFEVHQLEERNTEIDIPDKAFENLFDFFDEFSWHLDERPLRAGNEINPDVVGYIFEKYINQKQMGAYYTKEDITEYISKNTIIPFLFDAAQKKCPIAFKPESYLWRLLRDDPDRYIYAAVRQGVVDSLGKVIPLPKEIEAGVKDVAKRDGWNRAATDPYALPTETWREHVARRQRCMELRDKLQCGEVHAINDLITLNLDIWQFARDAIVNSEGPELVRAFWQAIAGRTPEKSNEKFEPGITVLDPTCGSGAFLFAALQILETLYSDCLQAMASFLDEPEAPPTPEEQLKAIVTRGENDRCEFKSTMRHCIKTAQAPMPEDKRKEVLKTKDKERNHDVLKSVAAMLNTSGGDVVVGVQDDGSPFGLEADYQYFSKESDRNADGYELWLRQLFVNHFGLLNSQKVRAQFVMLDGKQVLWLRVSAAETASFVTIDEKQKLLYVRNGNETRQVPIEEIGVYHQRRFSPEAMKALPGPAPEPVARPAKKKRGDDFRSVLDQIRKHPSERYFILKSIIIANLFGVDIMEEAVEICKLRLFLKLVSQVERVDQIEPLPDIDFNIRSGNTLVGYVTLSEIRQARSVERTGNAKQRLMLDAGDDAEIRRLEDDALAVEKCFEQFRIQQTQHGGKVTAKDKAELRKRLANLDRELDRYLAGEYGVDTGKDKAFDAWKASHQPFHWFVEFYGIMATNGFDVIIGNPPYIELKEITRYHIHGYACESAGNLYALVMEKCLRVCSPEGRLGFIVPVSSVSTERYQSLQNLISRRELYFSSFDDRPSRLFDGLQHIRLTVHILGTPLSEATLSSTRYNKWAAVERPHLFTTLRYTAAQAVFVDGSLPKLSSEIEHGIVGKLAAEKHRLSEFFSRGSAHQMFYSRKVGYFLQVLNFQPRVVDGQGRLRPPSEFKELHFSSSAHAKLALCCLNSSLFYWFVTVFSDCRHVNRREVDAFPIDLTKLAEGAQKNEMAGLASRLMKDLNAKSDERRMAFKHDTLTVQCIIPKKSKSIIDEIDYALAKHYGFTEEELDFIVNYDIKYRMGQEATGDDE